MTDISGILSINKPSGVSSFWAVKQVKRILGVKKVGHCGTLDPLAEGILVILFGKATKLQSQYMAGKKIYKATLKLGTVTDTGDITGKVTGGSPVGIIEASELDNILISFLGDSEQVPPMYSALKYGGRKLYEIAREGREVKREPRKISIYSIDRLNSDNTHLELRVECSKGTYIRTLAEDIGAKLGCGATIEALCREKSGGFTLENALDGKLLQCVSREELLKYCQFQDESIEKPIETCRLCEPEG